MGVHRQMPDRLRRLHPRFGTPWMGIIIFGGVASSLAILPGQADFLGNIYAFGAMLSFSIAHLAVIRLRYTAPDIERPYLGPLNVELRGVKFPVFAAIGLFGTVVAFVVVTILNVDVAIAGTAWLMIGCIVYVSYRRSQGLDLRTTTKVAMPKPVVEAEAEYDSVLVALDVRGHSPGAMATAVRLAKRRRRGIHVLVPIVVPSSSPLDAEMPEQERAAQTIIEQAKLQGGRRVTGHYEKVRAGQAGRLIVEEAREMSATAIVMPLPPRQPGSVFGKTLETVLQHRPCRVIIHTEAAAPPATRTPEAIAERRTDLR
jgi:APA family basic amino acid/polyamine antiporter